MFIIVSCPPLFLSSSPLLFPSPLFSPLFFSSPLFSPLFLSSLLSSPPLLSSSPLFSSSALFSPLFSSLPLLPSSLPLFYLLLFCVLCYFSPHISPSLLHLSPSLSLSL